MKRYAVLALGVLALGTAAPAASDPTIDLNRATYGELLAFRGIGRMYADKVVAARPFESHRDLVDRRVLPVNVYLALRSRLVVTPVADAAPQAIAGTVPTGMLDLNAAPLEDLLAVPGIGRQYAARIVAARPFKSEFELVGRRVVPLGVFQNIQSYLAVPR
ncbi:MAG: helix-hairpin-helix domain-containing protein [Gemmatimonadales bacterium]